MADPFHLSNSSHVSAEGRATLILCVRYAELVV